MSETWGLLAGLGRPIRRWVGALGILGLDLGRTAVAARRLNGRELVRGLVAFGWGSIPLAVGVAALSGAIVVAQTAIYVQRFGARSQLGWAAGYAVVWEFAPLLLAIMMGARVGARNAAELASLTLGGQVDGLRGVSLDPFAILVAPRALAIICSLGLLFSLAALVGVLVEALTAFFALHLPVRVFFDSLSASLSIKEFSGGLIKSVAFGAAIAAVSTSTGLSARGGARAVGGPRPPRSSSARPRSWCWTSCSPPRWRGCSNRPLRESLEGRRGPPGERP